MNARQGLVSQGDERVSRVSARQPAAPARRLAARWLSARSAGEILALAALALSALAVVVVLEDGGTPGLLREMAMVLLTRLESQANVATAIALGVCLLLAWTLAVTIRSRDGATARADRLARTLALSRDQVKQLHTTVAARDALLLAVVHELRSPLTHVVGYAELLSSGARPRHPDEVGEMSTAIQSASTTMLRLMDDLVEATRAQADGFSLKTRPIDLAYLIRGVADGYQAQGQLQQLRLDLPDHWLTVRADPERIHQILANLLTNAISYSPAGGEVRVSARSVGDRVRVEIVDHGIGLEAEDQQRVFDRFYRTSSGRALREQGSGLGLAIVRELVEAHGGEVGVSSQVGVGSTFWFTLPAADDRTIVSEVRRPVQPPAQTASSPRAS